MNSVDQIQMHPAQERQVLFAGDIQTDTSTQWQTWTIAELARVISDYHDSRNNRILKIRNRG